MWVIVDLYFLGKSKENKRKKDGDDKLLHHDLDTIVTRESKAGKVSSKPTTPPIPPFVSHSWTRS